MLRGRAHTWARRRNRAEPGGHDPLDSPDNNGGTFVPLADFGTVTFTSVTVNGVVMGAYNDGVAQWDAGYWDLGIESVDYELLDRHLEEAGWE